MNTWIALLRGVNVGGKNRLPMKPLAVELETAGLSSVKTYIQSGNIVFHDDKRTKEALASLIRKTIKNKFGLEVKVIVMSRKELASYVKSNPFANLMNDEDSKYLHLFFVEDAPDNLRKDRIEMLQQASEQWKLKGLVFYLYTPDGFGKSKLAAQVEKILGTPATARNWRTISTLLELAS